MVDIYAGLRQLGSSSSGTMPAASVSVLRSREVTGRTLGAIVIEMCQKGILAVTATPRGNAQVSKTIAPDDNATRPLDTTAERRSVLRPADGFYVAWMAYEFVRLGDDGLGGADFEGLDLDIDF